LLAKYEHESTIIFGGVDDIQEHTSQPFQVNLPVEQDEHSKKMSEGLEM
jgi:hypothetical protein